MAERWCLGVVNPARNKTRLMKVPLGRLVHKAKKQLNCQMGISLAFQEESERKLVTRIPGADGLAVRMQHTKTLHKTSIEARQVGRIMGARSSRGTRDRTPQIAHGKIASLAWHAKLPHIWHGSVGTFYSAVAAINVRK